MRRFTEVIAGAESYDLTDLETVREELSMTQTTNDVWLSKAISQVSKKISAYCNRVLVLETVTDTFEFECASSLPLSRYPISEIETVTANGVELTANTDYRLDVASGLLFRSGTAGASRWQSGIVVVSYSGGYEEIPDDIVEVAVKSITARFKARGRDPNVVEHSEGSKSERLWVGPQSGQDSAFPPELASILDAYKAVVV